MRADEEKSVGEMESLLAPFTPAKPISLMERQIYSNVQENESNLNSFAKMEAYMSRLNQENQVQVSAVGSSSSSSSNIHYPPEIVGNATNRAVRWTPLYSPPSQVSASMSNINSVLGSLPFNYNYQTGYMPPEVSSTDPLGQWNYVTFSDLLAMYNGGAPDAFGSNQTAMTTNAFLPNLNYQAPLMFEHQGVMGSVQNIIAGSNKAAQDMTLELNQRIENHQSVFSISSRNSYDLNAYPEPENVLTSEERPANMMSSFPDDGIRGFAPVTPDHFKKIASSAPGGTYSPVEQQNAKHSQVLVPGVDSLLEINETRSTTDSIAIESYNPNKESIRDLDLDQNKPIQQKQRRKKHRPKVVVEGKPKQPPPQRKPEPGVATETPRQKRKYTRKNKTNMPSTTPPPTGAEALGSKVESPSVKSCRKTLNFDSEDQTIEDNSFQISSNMASLEQLQHNQEEKDVNKAAHGYDAFDINVRNNQLLKDYMSIPDRDTRNVSQPTKATPSQYESSAAIESGSGRIKGRRTAVGSKKRTSAEAMHPIGTFSHSPHYTTCTSTNKGEHNKSVSWANPSSSDASNMASHCPTLQVNHMGLGNAIFSNNQGMYFPVIYKKRRTEKVFKPNTTSLENYPTEATKTSKYYYPTPVHCNMVAGPSTQATATHNHQDKTQFMIWADIDKLKKRKRSKVTTRVRNLDSLKGLAECKDLSRSTAKQRVKRISKKDATTLNNLPSKEALPVVLSAGRTGKRQSRKRSTKMKSVMSSFDILFGENSQGPFLALPWKDTTLVDAVIEGMKQLNINKEGSSVCDQHPNIIIPYNTQYQQENALVLYKRDGTMVPFKESEAKKSIKAKVDLDDETNRVWKLLLEDINSQGIDGTDEERKKWWENERNVFHGRVDSFIARMRLVQGDRHFSPWKGSVVDSVVGVFLTQNVSDHLSSSAFMTVAARFPLKSGQEIRTHSKENIGPFIEEPDVCTIDLNDNIESLAWNENTVEGPICDRNSRTLHDLDVSEEKVVNSKEPHGSPSLKDETFCHVDSSKEKPLESQMYGGSNIGKESEIVGVSADATSSQHSVISSQSSAESPSAPTSGTMGSVISSEGEILTTNSNPSSLHCSASFVELLRMAETPKLNVAYSPKDQALSYQSGVPDQEGIKEDTAEVLDSLSNVNKSPTLYQLCMTEGDNIKGIDEESRSVNSATSTKNLSTQQTIATDSRSNESPLVDNACSYYVLEGEELIIQQNITNSQEEGSENSPKSNANPPTLLMVETVVTESTCASNITVQNEFKPNPPLSEHNHTSGETQNVSNKDTTKKKKGRTAKKAAYDWESLRKRAQVNGKSRQHTANTMDSVDWEAVRSADVNEVADTIKDRGMNNVLAERIQAFLNRIVKDHGSIDLEWLRDIPPDKAKEYLLSIKGIGLKSVECVRLLTLHQLAFPVDTNVGRIAVRLGWVPLQPLPESLQLHLLEMYPILESIQKYLWPRLCKLDQRTLYELHYHMITFGKVFCTKKQPNCNACPLRGECRHFASAFTSSKLALPGPEDKRIVPSCKSNVIYQDPHATINYLPMPLSIEDHMLEVKSATKNYEPIVEIPASPEPEQIQTLEYDIEDALSDDPNEIPTIKLNIEEFSHNLQTYMQSNMELQEGDMSKALVALATEAASIPTPKLKNVNRLRTEHRVYELPDTHQLLRGLDKREPDDPCSYLLAIWTPGETANSTEAPEKRCSSQEQGELCGDETCFYCNSLREANKQTVRGTLLIPCRTAMRGSFPLNGTYFQVNEVFADHDSSLEPIEVPREWIWNLPRRTVYFGTSIPSIFKGLPTEGIQHCFWKGYVCVRGFERKTRVPRPLVARLHFPASRTSKNVKEATNVQREGGN